MTKRDNQDFVDTDAPNHNLISFGRCYMNSYSTEASVGDFPLANVSFVAENVMFETSGSGFLSPMIEPKSGNQFNNLNSVLPKRQSRNPISVVRPGDINFTTDNPQYFRETLHIYEDSIYEFYQHFKEVIRLIEQKNKNNPSIKTESVVDNSTSKKEDEQE